MSLHPAARMLIYSGHRKVGGKKFLAMIGYNPDALDPKIRGKFPIGIGFTFEFDTREVSTNGLPKDKPRDRALDRCDVIIGICSQHGLTGIHAGDVFSPKKVRHQLQLKAALNVAQIRRELVIRFGPVRIDEDAGWSFFRKFVEPTAVEREYAENRDTLTRIEESGVQPGSTKLVDFQFTGSKSSLKQLSALLAENGYAAEFWNRELIAKKPVSLDWWTFAENCADLRGVAQKFGCKFAGWGCLSDA